MSKIILAWNYPNLKPGMKVQVLTNEDHNQQGTYSKTSAWSSQAEARYCYKTYTLTNQIIRDLQEQKSIRMSDFPEKNSITNPDWVMHYADFKVFKQLVKVDKPVYQILKVQGENIENVVLTPDKELANKVKMNREEANKDTSIQFKLITFNIQKLEEQELWNFIP